MKLSMKILWQLLIKKKTIENLKKALEWWIVKEVIQKKINLIEEGKKIGIDEMFKHNEIINNSLNSKI